MKGKLSVLGFPSRSAGRAHGGGMGRPGAAVRALLAVLAAALVLVGCGRDGDRDDQGEPTPTTTASLPPPLDLCPGSIQGVRGFSVAADGGHVQAAMFGSGATTVVFANDSGNNPCEWLDFAHAS